MPTTAGRGPARAPAGAVLAFAGLLLCALVAGCGGGGTDDGPALAPLGAAPPPPGAPVKVMLWAPVTTVSAVAYPDLPLVAQAFANLVNAQGGVNGRPLVVLTCDEHGDVNAAAQCASLAVRERVLAVVGSYSTHADAYLPILLAAGVPYLGGAPLSAGDLTSPIAFPVTGGPSLLVTGAARLAAWQGCRRVALVRQDVTPVPLERYVRAGLATAGAAMSTVTVLPSGPEQVTDEVAEATADSDCVVLATSDQGTQRFLAAYQQRGAAQQLYPVGAGEPVGVAAQFPDLAGRTFLTDSVVPAGNGAWQRFRDAVAAAPRGPEIDAQGTTERQTWTAFEVFLQVARDLTRFDSAAMLVALRAADAVDTGGLVPALNFTRPNPLPGLDRLFNATVTYQRFDDGRFRELRPGFQDLTPALAAATRR